MSKFINNLKISTRIALLSATPLIGLATIGGNYLYGEIKIDEAIAKATSFSRSNPIDRQRSGPHTHGGQRHPA